MRLVLARGKATTAIAGVHLLVDSVALTALLALSGGVTNSFTTMYFVPMTLATQLSPRWTWAVAATSLLGFAALFVLAPVPAGPPGHEHHFLGHIRGMWVAFGMSAAFMTYFVHRIALSLARQRAELARLRMAAAQDRQLAALGTLAAGAAHELGSPLGTVAMLVATSSVMSEAERGEAIATIRRSCSAASTSCSRCRRRSCGCAAWGARARRGRWRGWRRRCARQHRRGALHDRGRREREQGAHDPADRGAGQIVRAVVANAVDACRQSVRARRGCDCGSQPTAEQARVTVIDDGVGMAPQAAAAAFDPFFSTKPEGQGMGLGLYLARAHLRALGGTIELESQPGHGTTVQVRFPLTDALLRAAAGARLCELAAALLAGSRCIGQGWPRSAR
jgi:two-component system sensor histidine kinase RegB